jgi:ABC-type multidrug transport system fused ATPase/permease subunit
MNAGYSAMFDRVLVFEDGVLIADDTPEALKKSNETYQSLIS